MAVKRGFEEEDKKVNLQSGVIGGGASNAPGTTAQGTGWMNLQQYLDTNKGSGDAIANDVLAGTNQEINQTKSTINDWAKSAQDRVKQNTLKDDWSSTIKSGSVDDLNRLDKSKFQAWKGLQNYWGAEDATKDQNYQDVWSKSKNTNEKIENANTWQGQQQLAKDTFSKKGRYSTGMGTLDAFLARGDAQGKFDQFKDSNKNFDQNIIGAKGSVNSAINQAKATGAANRQTVMDSISQRIAALQGEQDQRAVAANDAARGEADTVKRGLRAGYNQAFDFSNIDSDKYLSRVTRDDVATQAEIDALNALGGMDDDARTGGYTKGQGRAGFDWQGYQREVDGAFSEWSRRLPNQGRSTTEAPTPTAPPTAGGGSQAPYDPNIGSDPKTWLPNSGIPNEPMPTDKVLSGGGGYDPSLAYPEPDPDSLWGRILSTVPTTPTSSPVRGGGGGSSSRSQLRKINRY